VNAKEGMMLQLETTGLPNIFLEDGFERRETSEGRVLIVHDIPGLFAAIGEAVARKRDLTGAEVRFLRKRLELSQAELAGCLQTSEQTVSLWERGKVRIPGSESMLLRVLYLERMRREPSAWHLAESADVRAPERLVFRQTVEGWQERAVA
jgi:DNA-binding XRE family transcriptional regulator